MSERDCSSKRSKWRTVTDQRNILTRFAPATDEPRLLGLWHPSGVHCADPRSGGLRPPATIWHLFEVRTFKA